MKAAGLKNTRGLSLVFAALGGVVLLFIVAPLLSLVFNCTPGQLGETIIDEEVRESIWVTLWTSMAATLIFALAAIPFAYLLARKTFVLKGLVTAIIDLPIVIPHSAAGIALIGIVSKRSLVGKVAGFFGIRFIDSSAGIILAMAFVSLPFLINSARDGFHAVPERLEKAAMTLGASPLRVFFTVSVPLAGRGILSGLVLMWARGMSEFGAVLVIANHPKITPVLLYHRYLEFGLDYARPLVVVFLFVCLVFFVALRLMARGRNA